MPSNMYGRWIVVLNLNPEPWAVGTSYAGRKAGQIKSGLSPNEKLRVYKAALVEELRLRDLFFNPDSEQLFTLELVFCREIDAWLTNTGKKRSGNYADTTNLQKATEDALQGILLHNDRQVVQVKSTLVTQRHNTTPFIGIKLTPVEEEFLDFFYEFVMDMTELEQGRIKDEIGDNTW